MDLQEVKYTEISKKAGRGTTLKDVERAAHSQGIDLGPRKRDSGHVDYPKAKSRKKSGGNVRADDNKVIGGSADHEKVSNFMHSEKLKQGVVNKQRKETGSENPGYWKKGSGQLRKGADARAKSARKSDMRAAREKKYADRNKGFSRVANKPDARRKKVFEQFMAECHNAMTEA